jgi:hypothetical protein
MSISPRSNRSRNILRPGIHEPLLVDWRLTAVAGDNRKIELGQPVHHPTAHTGNVDDRSHPIVLVRFGVDVFHGLCDVTRGDHRVGFVMCSICLDPAAFPAHDHGLVLAKASDVGSDDRAFGALDASLLNGFSAWMPWSAA